MLLSFIPLLTSVVFQKCAGLSAPAARDHTSCSIPQQQLKILVHPISILVSSPIPSFSPITNSLLRYNDIEFWQRLLFVTELGPFLKVFNLASKTGGVVEPSTKWKACGIVVACLTLASPFTSAGFVTGSGKSPQCESDQTLYEVRACPCACRCVPS